MAVGQMETRVGAPSWGRDPLPGCRKNVSIWKAYNWRRWRFEKDVLPFDTRAPFVCECTGGDCLQAVELTMHEYEAAHMCSAWLAVRPGHVVPDDRGTVIMRHAHFWVVELGSD
jgi:predicted metal-binding protein